MSTSEGHGLGLKRRHVEDPDYTFACDNKRTVEEQKKLQNKIEQARSQATVKAYNIINKNFTEELQNKETEIEAIEAKLTQVQKALHLVRFAAVTNMYSSSAVIGNNRQEPSIHPAARKILQGKHPVATTTSTSEPSSSSTNVRIDMFSDSCNDSDQVLIPSYVSPKKTFVEVEPRGVQLKYKRRIIVGNVSRWIDCDQREDLSTHKWMIYVRGSKEEADISDVVSKVKFLIHQSYHPNNLIEVNKAPFHLTRRGWGEFPARIQIHFKNPVDKPIDVVHFLKLDKTYTGLQTLGAETVVDVWLHRNNSLQPKNEHLKPNNHESMQNITLLKPILMSEMKSSPPKEKLSESNSLKENQFKFQSNGHENDNSEVQTTFIRCKDKDGGSFILPVTVLPKNCQKRVDWNPLKSHQAFEVEDPKKKSLKNGVSENGTLSESILSSPAKSFSPVKASLLPAGTSLLRSNKFLATPPTSRPATPSTSPSSQSTTSCNINQNGLNWRRVLAGKRLTMSLEEFGKRISQMDNFFLHKNLAQIYALRQKIFQLLSFKDDEETFFIHLFRYFPLVSHSAKEGTPYRILQPFAASSHEQFQGWSLTRQRAAEWMRAKTIQKILALLKGPKKSTKELVLLARRFGFYVQTRAQEIQDRTEFSIDLINFSTFSSFESTFFNRSNRDESEDEVVVDVDDRLPETVQIKTEKEVKIADSSPNEKLSLLFLSDDNLDANSFIESTVRQIGFQTEVEEIQPGVFYPLAQRLLLSACQNFCQELLRRSHGVAFENNSSTIELGHVMKSIVDTKRLKFLTNFGLGKSLDPVSK